MSPAFAAQANAALVGAICGVGYFLLARVMEMASLYLRDRRSVAVMLAGFVVRLALAWVALWGLVRAVGLEARPLVLGFVVGYTLVLARESLRQARQGRARPAGAGH